MKGGTASPLNGEAVGRPPCAPGLVERLWAWEFLSAGRPPREMAAGGGLFAQAIDRAPKPWEIDSE
jgi:hypothetical protein